MHYIPSVCIAALTYGRVVCIYLCVGIVFCRARVRWPSSSYRGEREREKMRREREAMVVVAAVAAATPRI